MTRLRVGAAIFLLFLIGCGYQLEGKKNALPSKARTLAIPFVKNSSTKLGLGSILTDELSRQFTTTKFLSLTSRENAEVILDVKIESVKIEGATLINIAKTSSRIFIITAVGSLKIAGSGKLLWQQSRLSARQTFVVDKNPIITEMNEEKAMKKAARDLAEKIHNSIFASF